MHTALHWLALVPLLAAALAVGVCVHELLHLVPLRLANAGYTVTVCPTDETDSPAGWASLGNALAGGLVRVEVTHLPSTAPEWVVRVAALLPVALALPLLLVAAGALPDPVAAGDHVATVLLVAGAACGLPSPADWAVVWHGTDLYAGE